MPVKHTAYCLTEAAIMRNKPCGMVQDRLLLIIIIIEGSVVKRADNCPWHRTNGNVLTAYEIGCG